MNELSLFTGIGGGLLGGMLCGFKTICAVEIDPYCREVLLQRQRDSVLPLFPIWDDVRTFDGGLWSGEVDIVTGGFPCQSFSIAGKRLGDKDERNMWPDTIRVIREVRPRIAFMENVPGLIAHPYFGTILGDLAESGYNAEWACLGADDVGANHRRKRLWILANSMPSREWGESREKKAQANDSNTFGLGRDERAREAIRHKEQEPIKSDIKYFCEDIPNTKTIHAQGFQNRQRQRESRRSSWWSTEPSLGRVANGFPGRVDQLKGLGNAQVPLQMAVAFHRLYKRAFGIKYK